jgi:hypothetical protein
MPINGLIFDERENKAKNWGHIFKNVFGGDGILTGCEVSYVSDTVTVSEGYFAVCGRIVEIDGDASAGIYGLSDGVYKLVFQIDLTQPASAASFDQGIFVFLSDPDVLTKEDINANGTIYQAEFAAVTIFGGSITSAVRNMSPIVRTKQYTGTLTSAGWSGSAAPYTQTVTLQGISTTDNVVASVDFNSASLTARQQARDGWIYAKTVVANGVIFACDGTKPTVNIPMSFLVMG